MNEEWYNDRVREQRNPDWVCSTYSRDQLPLMHALQYHNYPIWLQKLLNAYEARLDMKDRMFSRFLLDIPHVPQDVLQLLRDLCLEPDR